MISLGWPKFHLIRRVVSATYTCTSTTITHTSLASLTSTSSLSTSSSLLKKGIVIANEKVLVVIVNFKTKGAAESTTSTQNSGNERGSAWLEEQDNQDHYSFWTWTTFSRPREETTSNNHKIGSPTENTFQLKS